MLKRMIFAMFAVMFSLAAMAQGSDLEYLYNDKDHTAMLTYKTWKDDLNNVYRYKNCYSGDIVIPEKTPNGYTVTGINEYTFDECENLTSISIPNTVKTIGYRAFRYCEKLSSVTIPASVETVGASPFVACPELKTLKIEDSDKPMKLEVEGESSFGCGNLETVYMGRDITCVNPLFRNHSTLKTITFGDKVTQLQKNICHYCTLLTSVTLGNGITVIPDGAFGACHALKTVKLPVNLTKIGNFAFDECENLTSISIPNTVKTIGYRAFRCCEKLSSFTIPASMETVGASPFIGCPELKTLKIEDSDKPMKLEVEGESSFGCGNLETVYMGRDITCVNPLFRSMIALKNLTFGDKVTQLQKSICDYCTSLTSVTLGNGITVIPDGAFLKCYALEYVKFPANLTEIGNSVFERCTALTTIDFPETLKKIGEGAFWDAGLTATLGIPASVTTISKHAFAYSKGITDIFCHGTVPPVCENFAFTGMNPLATLHVPQGTTDAYKVAECWKEFFNEGKMKEFDASTGIDSPEAVSSDTEEIESIYTVDGRKTSVLQQGVNVVRLKNGRTVKMTVK